MFPWKQSQSLTFLGCRRSYQWRHWSPCCLSSPGSGCRMPGCRLVATDDAGWSDGPWETDLCVRRNRGSCQRLTVPSIDSASSLLAVNREELTHRSSSVNKRLSLSSVGFDLSKFMSACQMKPTSGLKYLCPAGPAASWGPCPMGLTGLSALTVSPEHHTGNYHTFNSFFFLFVKICLCKTDVPTLADPFLSGAPPPLPHDAVSPTSPSDLDFDS